MCAFVIFCDVSKEDTIDSQIEKGLSIIKQFNKNASIYCVGFNSSITQDSKPPKVIDKISFNKAVQAKDSKINIFWFNQPEYTNIEEIDLSNILAMTCPGISKPN